MFKDIIYCKLVVIRLEEFEISKKNKSFKKFCKNFGNWNKCGPNWLPNWPIFLFISPFKCVALCAILVTLILCGVGLYGIIVLILLVLLFIFLP